MTLEDLLADKPAPRRAVGAREETRRRLVVGGQRLVVVDDDPTGGQTIQDARVSMEWSVEAMRRALRREEPVFFLSCNSRSLPTAEAVLLARSIGGNLAEAARGQEGRVLLASRSDSTLRGHFPAEVDALAAGFGHPFDGVLIAPAFFEAGRYTIDDVQWVAQGDEVVSAEQTEFARDPAFSYRSGNLREWVEEKTGGAVAAAGVRSVSLERIRDGGPDAVAAELLRCRNAEPILVNAACYEDLDTVVLGLAAAEAAGKRFLYRCSASFVKARGGFTDRGLLSWQEMQPRPRPGLVVVGSYVAKTSRQVAHLLESGFATGIELQVAALLDPGARDAEVGRACGAVECALGGGKTAAIYTTRAMAALPPERFLHAGKAIMQAVCEVVRRVATRPGFIVAKGGVTSTEVARVALGVAEATILGQIVPGVPIWRLGDESRCPGIPYVVFPGNVGGDDALTHAVSILQGARSEGARGKQGK